MNIGPLFINIESFSIWNIGESYMLHPQLTAVNTTSHKIPAADMNRLDSSQALLSVLIMKNMMRLTRAASELQHE